MKKLTCYFIFSSLVLTAWAQVPDSLQQQLPAADSVSLVDSLRQMKPVVLDSLAVDSAAAQLADSVSIRQAAVLADSLAASPAAQDTVPPKPPFFQRKLMRSFAPMAIRPGLDLFGPVQSVAFGQPMAEAAVELDLRRWVVVLEGGFSDIMHVGEQGELYFFETRGWFARGGLDVNLLNADPYETIIFLGMRYGIAGFENSARWFFEGTPEFPTPAVISDANQGLSASWFSLVGGLKAQVLPNFFMGYTFRARFGLELSEAPTLAVFDVPGYGTNGEDFTFGMTYHLYYRFSLRKPKPARTAPPQKPNRGDSPQENQ